MIRIERLGHERDDLEMDDVAGLKSDMFCARGGNDVLELSASR
jgi:hypothetical protein